VEINIWISIQVDECYSTNKLMNWEILTIWTTTTQEWMLLICIRDKHSSHVTISLYNQRDIHVRIEEFQFPAYSYIRPIKSYISIPINKRNISIYIKLEWNITLENKIFDGS